ncbi:STR8 [Scenedesmus sp. PABB004]|nr:STR8 [Scenedesmus sp. PABB004]
MLALGATHGGVAPRCGCRRGAAAAPLRPPAAPLPARPRGDACPAAVVRPPAPVVAAAAARRPRGARPAPRGVRVAAAPDAQPPGAGGATARGGEAARGGGEEEWCVLNFYHLADVADPEEMVSRHRAFIESRGLTSLCGRIYISAQGINCQGGGTAAHAAAYVAWVGSLPEFRGLFHTLWPAEGPAFPKLRLKVKPNLISLAGGMAALPVTDPAARATPLSPAEWREKLGEAVAVNADVDAGRADPSKRVVVMDLRNDYEWDAGHFALAPRPDEEVFAETPVGGGDGEVPSPLRGADPENTEVLMYCTGGIRCDVYSALLRARGFTRLYTLHGGVQHYLREAGGEHWDGSLFVFDGRMAINPALPPGAHAGDGLPAAVPCALCGGVAALPHVNCANIDCNELFIACAACKTRFHGCCCEACQSAPRLLRPIKINGGNYGSWNQYADVAATAPVIAAGRTHEGRVARRARRRAAMREKRQAALEERQQLRAAVKKAVRAAAAEAEAAAQQREGEQEQEQRGAVLPAARGPPAFGPGAATFKILHVSDTQAGGAGCAALDAAGARALAELLAAEVADGGVDLVVHTGDVVHGDDVSGTDTAAWATFALTPLAAAGVPAAPEARARVLAACAALPGCLVPPAAVAAAAAGGAANYELPVLLSSPHGAANPEPERVAFRLVLLDTGGGSAPKGVPESSLDWLESLAEPRGASASGGGGAATPPPALLFRHHPSVQLADAWRGRDAHDTRCPSHAGSVDGERVQPAPAADEARYLVALRALRVVVSAVGHDHANDRCCRVGDGSDGGGGGAGGRQEWGWQECYARHASFGQYWLGDDGATLRFCTSWRVLPRRGPHAVPRGVRVFSLGRNGSVATHLRLAAPRGGGSAKGPVTLLHPGGADG